MLFVTLLLVNYAFAFRNVSIFTISITGVGKSAFGNAFLQKNNVFKTSYFTESCTMELQNGSNLVNGIMKYYFDTPGLDSSDGNDQQNQINMIKSLNDKDMGINAYFIVIDINNPRMAQSIKDMIIKLNNFFDNAECWKQAGVIFTKCNYDDDEMPFKKVIGQKYRDDLKKFIKTLPNCENIDFKYPCFFVNYVKWESDESTKRN